jgi:hypothetical protein
MTGAIFTYHFGPFFHSTKTKKVMQMIEMMLNARIVTSWFLVYPEPVVLFG